MSLRDKLLTAIIWAALVAVFATDKPIFLAIIATAWIGLYV